MPWKPNSVGDKHDSRWARLSHLKRKGEPLCRLCHAGGKIVPAAVVDHIVPLEDGGTHEESNLMPLCKRCHDAIKTPTDLRVREACARSQILVYAIGLGGEFVTAFDEWKDARHIDFRNYRREVANEVGFDMAHALMLACVEGVLTARKNGSLPPCKLILITDDAAWTNQACVKYQVEVKMEYTETLWDTKRCAVKLQIGETEWLRNRYGNEYASRHEQKEIGTQSQTGS